MYRLSPIGCYCGNFRATLVPAMLAKRPDRACAGLHDLERLPGGDRLAGICSPACARVP